MRAGGIDVGPEKDSVSVIPPFDAISLISDGYITCLAPQNGSNLAILKNTEPEDGQERRFSTGNVAIPYAKVKILSRYLAASSGSCHDYCKYGSKQRLESETRHSMLNRITQARKKYQHMQTYISLAETRKKLAASSVLAPGSICLKSDTASVTPSVATTVTKKRNVHSRQLLLPKKTIGGSEIGTGNSKPRFSQSKPSAKPSALTKKGSSSSKEDSTTQLTKRIGASSLINSREATNRERTELQKGKERTELQKGKARTSFHSEKKSSARGPGSVSSMKTYKSVLMQPPISLSEKQYSNRLLPTNARRTKNPKMDFPVNNQIAVGKVQRELPSCEDMAERILHVVGSHAAEKLTVSSENSDQTADLSPSLSSFPKGKSSRHARNGLQNAQVSRLSAKRPSGCTQKGTHVTQTPPLSKRKQSGHRQVSGPSSLPSPSSCHSSASSKCGETETRNRIVNATPASKTRPRNGVAINTKAKDSMARSNSVWKGKKPELQPNIATPRRLRFRRTVSRDGSQSVKEGYRKVDLRKKKDKQQVNISEAEREKVILKHKEWEEKNQKQILWNNMIAETANKLVESRKGKVKALVNAFETVFTLQESGV